MITKQKILVFFLGTFATNFIILLGMNWLFEAEQNDHLITFLTRAFLLSIGLTLFLLFWVNREKRK